MSARPLSGLALGLGLMAFAVSQQSAPNAHDRALEKVFRTRARPLLDTYCVSCHVGKGAAGGLVLDASQGVREWSKKDGLLQKASLYLRTRHMPPLGMPQPTDAERDRLAGFFDQAIASQCRVANPGTVTLRRLNRLEYANSVRDLLGVVPELAETLPADDVGYGFDTIGDVLSMSPLLFEKLFASAENVAAVVVPAAPVAEQTVSASDALLPETANLTEEGDAFVMSRGVVVFRLRPAPGPGRLKLRLWAVQAGPELARAAVRLNGKSLGTLDVPGTREAPTVVEIPVECPPGALKVEVEFTNDYYKPDAPDPKDRDRNLAVGAVTLTTDVPLRAQVTPALEKLVHGLGAYPSDGTAQNALVRLGARAFRRPLATEEHANVVAVFNAIRSEGGSLEEAFQAGIVYLLCAPAFVYRFESAFEAADERGNVPLSGYEIATRIAYFLWSSTPDEALLADAANGRLDTAKGIEEAASRMLGDPKVKGLVDGFATQWLLLRKLEGHEADPNVYASFTPSLRSAMVEESERFFAYVVAEDRPVAEFLASDVTFVNGELARHYGIKPQVEGWHKVVGLPPGRGGLLGQAAFLTVTSNPNRTSPVKRGRFVLEQLLGAPLPPPPPDVGVIAEDAKALAETSLRERMESHRKDPACAGCHRAMDPIGFALERFDGVGRMRSSDGAHPIDDRGELPDGIVFKGVDELRKTLVARKPEFVHNLVNQLLTFSLGRGMRGVDSCHVDEARDRALADGGRFSDIVRAVVTSEPFRFRSPS